MPTIRDGRGVLTVDPNEPRLPVGSGPVERLAEPSPMVRVPDVGRTNADYMAASRARGAAAAGFVNGATKPHQGAKNRPAEAGGGPGKPPSQTGAKRTPEARERMRLAMVASWERRRGASVVAEPAVMSESEKLTDAALESIPQGREATDAGDRGTTGGRPPAAEVSTPLGLPEMAAAIDAAFNPDFTPKPIEGEDRCSFAAWLGTTHLAVCDLPAAHGAGHRGRTFRVGVTAGTCELLGHLAVPA